MLSYLGVKGSGVLEIVSWITIVLTVLISVFWYGSNFVADKLVLEKVENDLSGIRKMVDDACELSFYEARYNPTIEAGTLDINKTDICITTPRIQRCRKPICLLELYEQTHDINLSIITNIIVRKSDRGMEFLAE